MRLALILSIISFGSAAAFVQDSTVIGSIERVVANDITVKTPRGSFTIHADNRTEIVEDKTYHGLSALRVGDEISARCQPNASAKPRAVRISAKVLTLSAPVKRINGDEIEVVTIPNADYRREEHRLVHLYPDTAFGTARNHLALGEQLRVVGLDVGNGAVDASRVAVYNTDLPSDRPLLRRK